MFRLTLNIGQIHIRDEKLLLSDGKVVSKNQ